MKYAAYLLLLAACSDDEPSQTVINVFTSDASTQVECVFPTTPVPDASVPVTVTPDAGVDAATGKPFLLLYGNSLVYGAGASNIQKTSAGALLKTRLSPTWDSDWFGRGGYGISQLNFTWRADTTKYVTFPNKTVVMWEGVNDYTAGACEAYEGFTKRAMADGWRVVLTTAIPARSAANIEGLRQQLNGCIKGGYYNWGAAGLVDLAANPVLSDPLSVAYTPDKIHLSDQGYDRVAWAIHSVVSKL